jgi:tetratricopeptide (TPR) repeat protein
MILQRPDEALSQDQLAVELDPLNPLIQAAHAVVLIDVGDWEAAFDYCEKALALDPQHFLANTVMETASYLLGRYDKAFASMKVFASNHLHQQDVMEDIEKIYNEKGFDSALEELVRQLELQAQHSFIDPMDMAYRYSLLNQYDKAMDLIERAFEIHYQSTPYIVTGMHRLGPLYDDPRYINIVEKMNLPLPVK